MSRPKLLDLFCCEGGASMGYSRAGFDVYGVDLFRHRDGSGKLVGYRRERYPFSAHQGDALDVMRRLLAGEDVDFHHPHGWVTWLALDDFDAIAASPPCQFFSITKNAHQSGKHVDLLTPVRPLIVATGLPYVIENVPGAPLLNPLLICGTHFQMRATDSDGLVVWLKRHRLFESNVFLVPAGECNHPDDILCAGVYGNGAPSRDAARARHGGYTPPSQGVRAALMGIDWMSRNGLSQAIPPQYTEWIGQQLIAHLSAVAA